MFCRKNKKNYFEKKWGCHGTPGTPGVDGPGFAQKIGRSNLEHTELLYRIKKNIEHFLIR